jgi:hypothetical protein
MKGEEMVALMDGVRDTDEEAPVPKRKFLHDVCILR